MHNIQLFIFISYISNIGSIYIKKMKYLLKIVLKILNKFLY